MSVTFSYKEVVGDLGKWCFNGAWVRSQSSELRNEWEERNRKTECKQLSRNLGQSRKGGK